ncbi:MAG: anti-sigma factor family protein [Candidatus Brocadiia bacterium]
MNCDWAQHRIDDYELGVLNRAEREDFEAHLRSCPACRKLLDEARAADEAVRAALRWAEPSSVFSLRVLSRARRPARRWWAALAAAAAAAVALWLAVPRDQQPSPAEGPGRADAAPAGMFAQRLLAGRLYDAFGQPVARIERGGAYTTARRTAVELGERSLFLFPQGTHFSPAPDPSAKELALSVLSGTVLGQVDSAQGEVSVELTPELGGAIVRTRGCQFYGTGLPPDQLVAPLSARTLARWPRDIRVHVFTGTLELDLGGQKLALSQGDSAIISAGVSAGPTPHLEARAARLRQAIGADVLARRRRYRRLRQQYARRLLELREAEGPDAVPYLADRLPLVRFLLAAHAHGLAELEDRHPRLYELDAVEVELRRLDQLREEAERALERNVAVVCAAR